MKLLDLWELILRQGWNRRVEVTVSKGVKVILASQAATGYFM